MQKYNNFNNSQVFSGCSNLTSISIPHVALTFSVPFVARQKEQNNDKPKLLIKIF